MSGRGFGSRSLSRRFVFRQATEPARPLDGTIWIDTGANGGSNTTRSVYDAGDGRWEIDTSTGTADPDTDAAHVAVDGSLWNDTSVDPPKTKVYDETGAAWEPLSATDFGLTLDGTVGPTDTASVTHNLTDTYDLVMLWVYEFTNNENGATRAPHVAFNGVNGTSAYDWYKPSGTAETGQTVINLSPGANMNYNEGYYGPVFIAGRWQSQCGFGFPSSSSDRIADVPASGKFTDPNGDGQLNSVQFTQNKDDVTVHVDVYGSKA